MAFNVHNKIHLKQISVNSICSSYLSLWNYSKTRWLKPTKLFSSHTFLWMFWTHLGGSRLCCSHAAGVRWWLGLESPEDSTELVMQMVSSLLCQTARSKQLKQLGTRQASLSLHYWLQLATLDFFTTWQSHGHQTFDVIADFAQSKYSKWCRHT